MDETSQLGIAGTLAQSTAQVHITPGEQSVADLAVRRQTNPVAGHAKRTDMQSGQPRFQRSVIGPAEPR